MNASFLALLPWFIPLCTLASALLVAAIKMRPANTTADEMRDAGQYQRLLAWSEKMEGRVAHLEEEVECCHRERDTALAEVARLTAILLARGQMRAEAATIIAVERLTDARNREAAERAEEDET